jgi:O-antigen/teichoic acid export membrane protein
MKRREISFQPFGPFRVSAAACRRTTRGLLQSPAARQASGFATAALVASALAAISTAILTRNLETTQFGSFSLAVSILLFIALFFDFGLFSPAARLVALADPASQREVVGSALLAYLPVGITFSLTVFGLSFFVDSIFSGNPSHPLRVAALPAIAIPFILVLQGLAQGIQRLYIAAVSSVLSQLLIVAFFLMAVTIGSLSASSALFLRSLAQLLVLLAAALWLRPIFRETRHWTRAILRQAREWGFNAYVGRIFSVGTYNIDVLMLGIWASSQSVGFYSLAASLAAASGLPVAAMAPALFRKMARTDAIARRWLVVATTLGAGSAIIAWALAEPVIRLFFSARYLPAAGLVLPLALAQFARGVTGIFNAFFNAHGMGREQRDTGLILTASNLILNFLLIPPFGASGAAWASLLALLVNLLGYIVLYLRSHSL